MMRYPPRAHERRTYDVRNQPRWQRQPLQPSPPPWKSHPPRMNRYPTSVVRRCPSSSASTRLKPSDKASSGTLTPQSLSSKHHPDLKVKRLSEALSGSNGRHSTRSSSTKVSSRDSSKFTPTNFSLPDSSPDGAGRLPPTPEDQLPEDQVQMAISKLEESAEPQSRLHRVWSIAKWLIRDQWFLLAFALLVVIASQKQVATQQSQQIKQTITSYLCVSIIFFVTGCSIPTRTLLENYTRWKVHLVVQGQGFLMTSAITFGIVCALHRSPVFDPYAGVKHPPKDATPSWLLVGMLFMGCVPTSISSNVVLTEQAHGNMAFTVVQSTIGNFLAPFVTPLLMNMYTGKRSPFPLGSVIPQSDDYSMLYGRVFKQLGLSVFLPMVNFISTLSAWFEGTD